jgi:cytochrome c-type biogenesis protein CcmH
MNMARIAAAALMAFGLLLSGGPAMSVQPEERLDDPVLEARARAISRELRCVVCAGEVIDYSNADIARDLRILVRERLVAGDTDQEVRDYVVERYGEYVLMRPPFSARNAVLWIGPLLLLGAGGALAIHYVRGQRLVASPAATPLSAEEEADLARIVADPDDGGENRDG